MLNSICKCMYLWGNSHDLSDVDDDDDDHERDFDAGFSGTSKLSQHAQEVCLDVNKSGQDVVIVKSGRRLCGSGVCLSNYPIIQNKAYFECKIQAAGLWCVGLATRRVNLDKMLLGNDSESWVLREDSCVYHDGNKLTQISSQYDEGDVIGVTYDHELLVFYLNGSRLECQIQGIRGTVYPVFSVDNGAILDVNFNSFIYKPPLGYDQIMVEKSII